MNKIVIITFVILLITLGLFFYKNTKNEDTNNRNEESCTTEAKLCPDGTAVGREGPNCEFSACPKE